MDRDTLEIGGRFTYDPFIHKMRMPVETINVLGGGGIEGGTVNEFWGVPRSGKSTAAYECAEVFLKDYGEHANVVLCDASNASQLRLQEVFHLHAGNLGEKYVDADKADPRVKYYPTPLVEDFWSKSLNEIKWGRENNKATLIILDDLTTATPKDLMEKVLEFMKSEEAKEKVKKGELTPDDVGLYSAGMMIKARVLRECFNELLGSIFGQPIWIIVINQITTKMTKVGGTTISSLESGGGWGVKHTFMNSLKFNHLGGGEKESEMKDRITGLITKSGVEIKKSKSFPSTRSPIPIFIRDDKGGRLSPSRELFAMARELVLLIESKGYYRLSPELAKLAPGVGMEKSFRESALLENSVVLKAIKTIITRRFRSDYFLVDRSYVRRDERLKKFRERAAQAPKVMTTPDTVTKKQKATKAKKGKKK